MLFDALLLVLRQARQTSSRRAQSNGIGALQLGALMAGSRACPMHSRNFSRARWRMTRALTSVRPSSRATASAGLSAKNPMTSTERSRSGSDSRQLASFAASRSSLLGGIDRLGYVAVDPQQPFAPGRPASRLQHDHAAHPENEGRESSRADAACRRAAAPASSAAPAASGPPPHAHLAGAAGRSGARVARVADRAPLQRPYRHAARLPQSPRECGIVK